MPQTADNGMRILAVDDEDSLLRLYQQVIESKMPDDGHYDLTLCSTGEAAVEAVSSAVKDNRPFSLGFMDINLSSEHDGVWTAAEIRKQDPDIQIVFVTGLTNIDLKETTKRVPPPDKLYFLQKPFQPAEIVQFAISLCARWSRDREYLN